MASPIGARAGRQEAAGVGKEAVIHAPVEEVTRAGVEALAAALERRDSYTAWHSTEVVDFVGQVAERLDLDEPEVTVCELAGRLHDVGKIGVPDTILLKPGPLDRDEWTLIKRHPVWSAEMLAVVPGLERVAQAALHHHERYDGGGYPYGLRGEEIPLSSRVVTACDAYHAMRSERPYRGPLAADEALAVVREERGTQFDPAVVDALDDVLTATGRKIFE